MDQDTKPPFTREALEAMNKQAIENQFFTPDHVYFDLSLLKDFPIGAIYTDAFAKGETQFNTVQSHFLNVVQDYQVRTYDTSDALLSSIGYPDQVIESILADTSLHASIFLLSPATNFFNFLIRQTIRNQNHSSPKGKFKKKSVTRDTYALEAMPVTYYINTFPLTLPAHILDPMARELGESFGVNVQFLNKDPHLFDQTDWNTWLEKIECFYLNSLGRFTSGEMILVKQGNMELAGVYIFARKRFEKHVIADMKDYDFSQQVAIVTAHIDMLCDFEWISNQDLSLTPDAAASPDTPSEPME